MVRANRIFIGFQTIQNMEGFIRRGRYNVLLLIDHNLGSSTVNTILYVIPYGSYISIVLNDIINIREISMRNSEISFLPTDAVIQTLITMPGRDVQTSYDQLVLDDRFVYEF